MFSPFLIEIELKEIKSTITNVHNKLLQKEAPIFSDLKYTNASEALQEALPATKLAEDECPSPMAKSA